jgi:hypothetical protein
MRPLYTDTVTSLDKCRLTFYRVIKCTLSKVLHNLDTIWK